MDAEDQVRPQAPAGHPGADDAADAETVEEAERAYVEGLIARGEAAVLDDDGRLPAGATHELVEDDEGRLRARRRRFTAF